MARRTVEIETCDLCGGESKEFLSQCLVCKREYCARCSSSTPRCQHNSRLCKDCVLRQDVIDVMREYSGKITPLLKARDHALSFLPWEKPTSPM